MKAVILAGGYGTRLSEETHLKPKPMVEIGNKPILWHIMKFYSSYGIKDFIICCGYKGYIIKEYFNNYFLHTSDLSISLKNNSIESFKKTTEDWKITLVDTGEDSMTGGRLKRVKEHLGGEDFCFTYGDGLSDINIDNLIRFHKKSNKLATVSAVYPPARFGALEIKDNQVTKFIEKPEGDGTKINGGYFILSPKVIDYIKDDFSVWEKDPLERLASEGELSAYDHKGNWVAMDTLRDKEYLEKLWNSKKRFGKIGN